MNISQVYILISIVVLAIIMILVIVVARNRKVQTLTPLTGLAFGFILAGIFFGENRILGYILMGIGVLLAVFDMLQKMRNR